MDGDKDAIWREFSGLNTAYLLDLYERYQAEPESVSPETRQFFDRWGAPPAVREEAPAAPAVSAALVAGTVALATAIRAYGHRAARLDPLGSEPPGDVALLPETHGIQEEALAALPAFVIGGPVADTAGNALAAIRVLREVYLGTTGYEFEHVSNAEERHWLRAAVESGQFRPPKDPIDELKLLERLTEVGAFERFLRHAFPAQTRFSLEGLGMLVPMLDEIVGAAAEADARCLFLGMAHRGRLNVLAHTLGKPYEQIIAEFMGHYRRPNISPSGSSDEGWSGDVKYHLGARKAYRGGRQVEMLVYLAPNPSHLEWVNPVAEGMTRACNERRDAPGPARQDELASLAVLLHGDASFPGQGIVAETLNLSRLPGYRTGGTIHLIANNQIGFTTPPFLGRSTLYASDLAKGFEIPIIHVNADDPEACLAAARLAHAYRQRFRKDVLIDLIGYRRWGHNEGDEPTFTQPLMYARITQHPTIRELWAQKMVERGLVTAEEVQNTLQQAIERLHAIRRSLQAQLPEVEDGAIAAAREAESDASGLGHPGAAAAVETAVPAASLAALNEALYRVPADFHLHPKLQRPFARRRVPFTAAGEGEESRIEWAHAEALAFASILADGTAIRLTGQDTARGAFSQRHAVLHDVETGRTYCPLQALPSARASFEVWDSPLSEQSTLGFEFGYSVQASEAVVVWEAQYGDFINIPQAIIDEFIVSARSKWGLYSALVLLLPHGYEGQGPDHSSARLERFLQLAAEDNLRIANCTTSAQYFHILRRQARLLSLDPRPLVLLTPKSLLRHPLAASPQEAFSQGHFQPVIDDPVASREPGAIRRLILCSGKVYFDLVAVREQAASGEGGKVAAARVEELYPFPAAEVARVMGGYPNLEEVVWLQEEPRNMGAWTFVAPHLRNLLMGRLPLLYIGRPRRASPAEGAHEWHVREQTRLIEAAVRLGAAERELPAPEVQHAD
ncbi:MAG: 2-oxoglutarate dehydrogenase E1 component [Armatimonadetes bacterium]|nr:2-oxoglutarate dehydrogenase E1 component [Armatimonadota bacterium]